MLWTATAFHIHGRLWIMPVDMDIHSDKPKT